ncbi:hypothetical protein [Streptomyces aidingensis]|uniref:Uncharacterized protein n=1 Tax=Streptomyces aidingensis TaxID=910347 RepID=A0A1I1GXS4_9ACTN|nr:hypothetical protein [Streptomyces aidingensis]SFC16649.1 hypothetical protein SAMN05421773_102179 [Streptomyces aidingensis]
MLTPHLRHPDEDQPTAVKGCATCTHLDRFRQRASAAGDGSAVSDANVRMRRHQKAEHSS